MATTAHTPRTAQATARVERGPRRTVGSMLPSGRDRRTASLVLLSASWTSVRVVGTAHTSVRASLSVRWADSCNLVLCPSLPRAQTRGE
jgi:hypothetical protein